VEKQPGVPYERLGLTAIRRLLERLDDPQKGLRVIHVAGSKGKGSTALFAEAICRAAGERVGSFTSPHLERWTERFRIDGREVTGERLAAAVSRLQPHVDALRAEDRGSAPTFFDATTAAALLLFSEAEVDRVVLEVGLGGRLDSTNVVVPAVTCVTSIELEHTEKLGDSLAEIAREKAGILKAGVPAVAGDLPAPARTVLAERAREIGTEVAWLGSDFDVEVAAAGPDGLALRLRDGPLALDAQVPVLGAQGWLQKPTSRWPPLEAWGPPSCRAGSRCSAARPGCSWTARTPPYPRAPSPARSPHFRAAAATSCSRSPPARTPRRSSRPCSRRRMR
jgi:dihydrofolate synthase/folylpolyglutamate synthase